MSYSDNELFDFLRKWGKKTFDRHDTRHTFIYKWLAEPDVRDRRQIFYRLRSMRDDNGELFDRIEEAVDDLIYIWKELIEFEETIALFDDKYVKPRTVYKAKKVLGLPTD